MKRHPAKVRIVVELGLETTRPGMRTSDAPDSGEYRLSILVAERLTRSMARELAVRLKQDIIRRGFRPLKGVLTLR